MSMDEFAFFNQQLAGMLREGVPLEGALRQLSANMREGALRAELQLLEADLQNGVPLKQAIVGRKLPEFYVQMVQVGLEGNDLPAVLLMLADYYQRVDSVWTRLKGLMVYPLLVLCLAFVLSCFLTFATTQIIGSGFAEIMGFALPAGVMVNIWAPPILIGALLLIVVLIFSVPGLRRSLRWRVPAFKEAKLAQVASAMGLMLKSGGNLGDSLGLLQQMEKGTIASAELAQWQARLAHGRGQFDEMATPGRAFPPLFLWLIANAGEDLAGGFRRTAEIYSARANHRIEMFLYAALPFSILALGAMICCQIFPLLRSFTLMLNSIGS
ncbi:MAG: Type secretion system protein [Pedosphaera sp.]|nr:Type secretion system protein [Pedosphaera sp.]